MTHKMARITILSLAAVLMVAAVAGCGLLGGGEEEVEEPTPDLAATIQAAVAASIPTETPTPPPTDPPTPDIQGTIDAALIATQIAMAPAPTDVPPTEVPVVAATNTPAPTDTPQPTPTPQTSNPVSGPPAQIAGKVTINGQIAGAGIKVTAEPQNSNLRAVDAVTNTDGNYILQIFSVGQIFDLYVGGTDSGVDTESTVKGITQYKNLVINR